MPKLLTHWLMANSVQFFINNQVHGPQLSEVPAPNVDDVVEVDGKRYVVRMIIPSYRTTTNSGIVTNVYLEPAG